MPEKQFTDKSNNPSHKLSKTCVSDLWDDGAWWHKGNYGMEAWKKGVHPKDQINTFPDVDGCVHIENFFDLKKK